MIAITETFGKIPGILLPLSFQLLCLAVVWAAFWLLYIFTYNIDDVLKYVIGSIQVQYQVGFGYIFSASTPQGTPF